jgi:hypothetical protein
MQQCLLEATYGWYWAADLLQACGFRLGRDLRIVDHEADQDDDDDVVDIRNGLYVLRYTGRHAREVNHTRFLEGNSKLGDALRLAGSAADWWGGQHAVPASRPNA